MAYIIIDLEFNNLSGITKYYPNIFQENETLVDIGLENEIIEIGAIKLDNYMKPLKEFKVYIKPTAISILNPKISEITNITEDDLKYGVSFEEGIKGLSELIDENDIICSWAKDDITEIINNAVYHDYKELKWLKNYLDIQEYFTKILAKKKSLSLKNALEDLKIKIDTEKLHDALNDAIYTSFVFKRIYNSRIVKNYVISNIYDMPAIEIKNLSEYKVDINKIKENCPKCKIDIEVEFELKPVNWRFMSMGKCPKCKNKVLNEIIIKRSLSGQDIYIEVSTIIDEIEYINYSYKFKK